MSKKDILTDTESRFVVARGGVEKWAEWIEIFKRYKCPFKKPLSPRNTMYSEVTIVSHPGLHA